MIQTQLGSRQSQHTRMPDAAALATLIDIQQISLMETASNALAEVAVLTVPRLADICIIGTSDQLASFSYTIAHRDPAQRTTLHQTISTMTAGVAHTTNDHIPHEWYGLVNHHGQYSQAISPLIDCILQHFPNYSFILIDIETTLVQSSFVIFLSQPDEPHYTANDLNLAQSIATSCVRIFESENMRLTAQRHARAVS